MPVKVSGLNCESGSVSGRLACSTMLRRGYCVVGGGVCAALTISVLLKHSVEKKKRGSQGNANKDAAQRLSLTTLPGNGLGLDSGGGQGGGEKGEGDQNPAGVLQQHVMCQHGSVPNMLEPLQHGNIQ